MAQNIFFKKWFDPFRPFPPGALAILNLTFLGYTRRNCIGYSSIVMHVINIEYPYLGSKVCIRNYPTFHNDMVWLQTPITVSAVDVVENFAILFTLLLLQ